MKSRLILTCAVLAITLTMSGCLTGPPPHSGQICLEASCDDFRKLPAISDELVIVIGDTITVTLCSNPSTGHQWSEAAQISDQAVLQQTAHEFVPPPKAVGCAPPPPGAAGKEIWTFKALKQGESTISMEYSQPWEGGLKATWTFVLTVHVMEERI